MIENLTSSIREMVVRGNQQPGNCWDIVCTHFYLNSLAPCNHCLYMLNILDQNGLPSFVSNTRYVVAIHCFRVCKSLNPTPVSYFFVILCTGKLWWISQKSSRIVLKGNGHFPIPVPDNSNNPTSHRLYIAPIWSYMYICQANSEISIQTLLVFKLLSAQENIS